MIFLRNLRYIYKIQRRMEELVGWDLRAKGYEYNKSLLRISLDGDFYDTMSLSIIALEQCILNKKTGPK